MPDWLVAGFSPIALLAVVLQQIPGIVWAVRPPKVDFFAHNSGTLPVEILERPSGLAAASAYTHPLADVHQTKYIVGPAAYAALALELDHAGNPSVGDAEVRWAIKHAPSEVSGVLLQMPARQAGKTRLETLLYELDAGIRARTSPRDA